MSYSTNTLCAFVSQIVCVRVLFAALAFLICLSAVESAQAQLTLTVTRTDDRNTTCVTGDCSLREAVNAANAASSNDTINFANTVTTITLTSEIEIDDNGTLTINGNGANVLTISGGGTTRIFYTNSAIATITGVTLTGGNGRVVPTEYGGGIFAYYSTLVFNGVHITANSSTGNGGGIYFQGGTHQILNSTFSANTGPVCAGLTNSGGTLSITNSTISGKNPTFSGRFGGGFCNMGGGNTTLRSVTIAGNAVDNYAGGIYQISGTINLGNSIVAGNIGGSQPDIYLQGGTITAAGYNLIGNNSSVEAVQPPFVTPIERREI